MSSNLPPPLPLLAIEGKAELKAACMLEVDADCEDDVDDFLGPIEKSWTSLKSIAPAEADFIISAIFILGKLKCFKDCLENSTFSQISMTYLDDKSIAPPIEEGGGVFRGGTAGLLNCPDDCRLKGAC